MLVRKMEQVWDQTVEQGQLFRKDRSEKVTFKQKPEERRNRDADAGGEEGCRQKKHQQWGRVRMVTGTSKAQQRGSVAGVIDRKREGR